MSPFMDEPFAEADQFWQLELLYGDLAESKSKPLTMTEKTHLRGLLLGFSPQQIAQELHCSVSGLRVALSRTIYTYLRILYGLQEIDYKIIPTLLNPRYRRLAQPDDQPTAPGGQLPLTSPYYIERPPVEQRCRDKILRSGALICIKAPRQMGKTSLMTRILAYANEQGCRTVSFSFQVLDEADFTDLKTFLHRFCAYVTRELSLPNRISEVWNDAFGNKLNCSEYFKHHLLAEITQPLVLALDEVDRIFEFPQLAKDFLGMLRYWYEEGQNSSVWQKFRLIVVHSSEVPFSWNPHQSPFNVGERVQLRDFRPEEVWLLVHQYDQTWKADQIEQLLSLVSGHPFLLQMALYRIAMQELTLDELLQTATTEDSIFQEHLRRYLGLLQQNSGLWDAMKSIVHSDRPIPLNPTVGYQLLGIGLVRTMKHEPNLFTVRCGLYQEYFRDRLE
jgi:serine/threonine-protein kinase